MSGPAESCLFQPLRIGETEVASRVAMAPLTRGRAKMPGNVPSETSVDYYRARARGGAALIFTEATFISPEAVGWYRAPGIWSQEQAAAWRRVVDAVHAEGARICMQLWHTGRVGHSALAGGVQPVSASPIALKQEIHVGPTQKDKLPAEVPRELPSEEIPKIVNDYRKAAGELEEGGAEPLSRRLAATPRAFPAVETLPAAPPEVSSQRGHTAGPQRGAGGGAKARRAAAPAPPAPAPAAAAADPEVLPARIAGGNTGAFALAQHPAEGRGGGPAAPDPAELPCTFLTWSGNTLDVQDVWQV